MQLVLRNVDNIHFDGFIVRMTSEIILKKGNEAGKSQIMAGGSMMQ